MYGHSVCLLLRPLLCLVAIPGCFFLSITATGSAEEDDPAVQFHNRVVPILKQHCFACHSHAAGTMEGNLGLDWRSGWETGGDRGPAAVAGKSKDSLLIQAVKHEHSELRMPEKRISDAEIAILEEWVDSGAFDDRVIKPISSDGARDWWSLRPLQTPLVPVTSTNEANPIDAFVIHQLEQSKLTLSGAASRRALIRRLSFDLIGLPPSYEETIAFEKDTAPDAYERLVDRLLDSPRYGERWARHWLDSIHFADSHGFEHDIGRDNAWPYRDYVIKALNDDLPWNRFIEEQLAVDVLYPEQTERTPALGFLGAGTFDLSTFSTATVTFDYLDRDDLVTQTMAAFCSTTANCARCHAHKFDPISQEDYYSLQAVFSGMLKGEITYDENRETSKRRGELQSLNTACDQRNSKRLFDKECSTILSAWIEDQKHRAHWKSLEVESFLSTEGATLSRIDPRTYLASGVSPDKDTYVITASTSMPKVTAIRLDVLPHDSLPSGGPGRCQNGNLHLSEFECVLFDPKQPEGMKQKINSATADFNQTDWGIERSIDGVLGTAWGIHPAVAQAHHAVFTFEQPIAFPEGGHLVVTLKQLHGGSHLIGAFQLSATSADPAQAIAIPLEIERALATASQDQSQEEKLTLAAFAVRSFATRELQKLPAKSKVFAGGASVQIPAGEGQFQAKSIAQPKEVHVLHRGDFDKPRQTVEPGALAVLESFPARFSDASGKPEGARRAALARWIAHRENVLTWRSVVNRTWHFHFGKGLCDTPSDFGRMGGVPSHPELLDWLACWFRDDANGELKKLHRLIVTSRTYQQSSQHRSEGAEIDSDNRLLWRQNMQRLDADCYRDFVLHAAGNLDLQMGGPGVQYFTQSKGPQVTPSLDYDAYDWSLPRKHRRSVYRYVWRGIADPFMEALDFPDLGLLAPTRSYSTSSLQALALFNNDFVLGQSQALARSALEDQKADLKEENIKQLVVYCVRRVWLREPTTDELDQLYGYAAKHGLEACCRLLFNSDEFLFVE